MRAFWLLLGVTFVAGAGLGCARSAEERQMSELREEIAKVQSDRDRFEQRVNALEVLAADGTNVKRSPAPPARATALPAEGTPTPKLRVVHLNPDGTEEGQTSAETAASAEDPDDSAPRPTIRIAGTPERKDARRGPASVRPAAQIEQTIPDEAQPARNPQAPATPRPSALDPDAKRAYDSALALVNARQYNPALDAFAAFLVRWPDHPNADNAIYWRGESYFAQGEFSRATEQFEGVIARFPLGNKVPDALLKLGICQQKLGNPQKAKTYFEKLSREYPRSEAARRIPAIGAGESRQP